MKLWIRWLFVDYRYVSHRAMVLRHPPYIGGGQFNHYITPYSVHVGEILIQ